MLCISYHDIQRATLPTRSGNEGWIGVSPDGTAYHVVVPVDRQIAKGVMACNLPKDGTPFGGYSGWLYFPCPNYDDNEFDPNESHTAGVDRVKRTARELSQWLASYDIPAQVEEAAPERRDSAEGAAHKRSDLSKGPATDRSEIETVTTSTSSVVHCPTCGEVWERIGPFLRDTGVAMLRYQVRADDFRLGAFVFTHTCGGSIHVGVRAFGRSKHMGKSLAGTHACPGYCHYESSVAECTAVCEGSVYRRIAKKLKSC
jgi:hypothetical protein